MVDVRSSNVETEKRGRGVHRPTMPSTRLIASGCVLCGSDAKTRRVPDQDLDIPERSPRKELAGREIECRVCGTYRAGERWLLGARHLPEETRRLLQGLCRESHEEGLVRRLPTAEDPDEFLEELVAQGPSGFLEQVDRLLRGIARRQESPAAEYALEPVRDYPLCYGKGPEDLLYACLQLLEEGMLEVGDEENLRFDEEAARQGRRAGREPERDVFESRIHVRLTHQGWMRIRELLASPTTSTAAFVAMPFGVEGGPSKDEMTQYLRIGVKPGAAAAGYNAAIVGDEPHVDRIDDRILADIQKARFVVADLTGGNPNVLFEAGYALGLGKTVFWTCEDSRAGEVKETFDIRQYNHIRWRLGEEADLADRLAAAIESVIGPGPGSGTRRSRP